MKLPLPLLLHLSSVGMLAFVGLTVKSMVPHYQQGSQNDAQRKGIEAAKDKLTTGRAQGPTSESWNYGGPSAAWWAGFGKANLIGKLPPPPPELSKGPNGGSDEPQVPKQAPLRPLAEVIELVSLVYDGKTDGKGGTSHVILRFKPDVLVEPPEWWVRENTAANGPGMNRGPADAVRPAGPARGTNPPPPATAGGTRPNQPAGGAARPPISMPVGNSSEKVQRVWVQDDGDPRRSSSLWTVTSTDGREVGKVRLVRVAADAQSAFFVRELPPLKAGEPPQVQPEEELIKTSMNIPQEVLAEMRRLQGRSGSAAQGVQGAGSAQVAASGQWIDQPMTSRVGNQFNIGRDDERQFRERSEELFERLDVDTYVSKTSNMRGVYVRNVEPELATKFGVGTGDVLLEVNGRKVESKAQAIQAGKADYNRGVRSFTTKWLTSSGQVVDRTYQAPDR